MKQTIFIFALLLLFSCKTKSDSNSLDNLNELPYAGSKNSNTVVIHELSDPDKLNPLTSQGASSTYIEHSIFMYLLDIDKEKLEVLPWLAKELPTITALTEGPYPLKIEYEIRPEAVWDNGTPVTAYDVEFSFKCTKNPYVDAEHQRPYIDFIYHIEIDPTNPKKFALYTNELYYAAEFSSGGVNYIIPEYIYDPEKMMRQFSLKDLSDEATLEKLKANPALAKFGEAFNSEKFQREVGSVVGCGPYELVEWTTGQRIVLKKKENWWGNALAGTKSFENYPDELIYEIINDQTTAITALKDEQIDILRNVRPNDYHVLSTDKKFHSLYFMKDLDYLSYTYIGLNMKHPILSDKNVRQALAHCVDVQEMIDVLNYGYAKPLASFVHPSKAHYNNDLQPYSFDLEKASSLLKEAGWEDTNGDGILDKVINGVSTPLHLTIKYNAGNDVRENICLFMKENASKIGIDLQIETREWSVYLDECTKHDFDMYVLGWVQEAILDDPKQLFHTEAYNGGSNYPGFGTAETDALIDNLRKELDEDKRTQLFKDLQAIVHDEVPYILLYTPNNLVCINKRFGNVSTYLARPGYEEREFVYGPYKGVSQ